MFPTWNDPRSTIIDESGAMGGPRLRLPLTPEEKRKLELERAASAGPASGPPPPGPPMEAPAPLGAPPSMLPMGAPPMPPEISYPRTSPDMLTGAPPMQPPSDVNLLPRASAPPISPPPAAPPASYPATEEYMRALKQGPPRMPGTPGGEKIPWWRSLLGASAAFGLGAAGASRTSRLPPNAGAEIGSAIRMGNYPRMAVDYAQRTEALGEAAKSEQEIAQMRATADWHRAQIESNQINRESLAEQRKATALTAAENARTRARDVFVDTIKNWGDAGFKAMPRDQVPAGWRYVSIRNPDTGDLMEGAVPPAEVRAQQAADLKDPVIAVPSYLKTHFQTKHKETLPDKAKASEVDDWKDVYRTDTQAGTRVTVAGMGQQGITKRQKFSREQTYHKDVMKLTGEWQIAERMLRQVASADPKTATGQLTALYSYIRALDPNSVVREGEVALARQGQSLLTQLENAVQRINNNQVLEPKFVQGIIEGTKQLAKVSQDIYGERLSTIDDAIDENGLDRTYIYGGTATGVRDRNRAPELGASGGAVRWGRDASGKPVRLP